MWLKKIKYICEHNRTCKASNEVMIDHRSFWRRPLRISDLLKFEWDSYWIFFFKWWVKLRLNASSHLTWKISDFSSLTNWKLQVSWVCMSSRKSQKKKVLEVLIFFGLLVSLDRSYNLICVSSFVHSSVRLLVMIFSQHLLISFSDFLHEVREQ